MDKVFYERWGHVHVARRAGLGFAAHMHDEAEIIFIREGPIIAYVDGEEYILNDNSLLITFPNQLHSYVDGFHSAELKNYITIFKSDVLRSFLPELDKIVPQNPVITDPQILNKITPYFEEAVELKSLNEPYVTQALNACATLILSKLLPSLSFKKAKKLQKDASADIFAYCNRNFCDDISLENMAKELNISKEHIMRLFRERFHTSFRAYINRLRIDKAKNLLKTTDRSITDISTDVGYNTIRTFNREFFAITKLTPSEYRQQALK